MWRLSVKLMLYETWRTLKDILTKDSVLVGETTLDSYHLTHCISAQKHIGMYCTLAVLVAVIRNIGLILNWQQMHNPLSIVIFYAFSLILHFYLYYSYKEAVHRARRNKHHHNLVQSLHTRLRWIAIMFMCMICIAFAISIKDSDRSYIGFRWCIFLLWTIYVSVWLVEGMRLKVVFVLAFNTTYLIFRPAEPEGNSTSLVVVLISQVSAVLFCLGYHNNQLDNFVLKQQIRTHKKIYQQLVQKLEDPVLIFEEGKMITQNESSRTLLGFTTENYRDRCHFIIAPDGSELGEHVARRLGLQKEECPVESREFFSHDAESQTIDVSLTLQVTFLDLLFLGRPKAVALVMKDTTAQQKREEKKAEEKYRTMLLFSLSHELRTPLNILQSFLHNAKSVGMNAEQKASYRAAKGAWASFRSNINQLFDYAQVMVGEFKLHPISFSLSRLSKSLVKAARLQLGTKASTVTVASEMDPQLPDSIMADRDRLELVLFILLANAAKWTEAGRIELQVVREAGNKLRFSVLDTGRGMSEAAIDNILRRSAQQPGAEHRNELQADPKLPHAGLGLTVTRMICRAMSSDISISSIESKGTTFSFLLPSPLTELTSIGLEETLRHSVPSLPNSASRRLFSRQQDLLHSQKEPKEEPKDKSGNVIFVVADDNEMNRMVAMRMIQKRGFQALPASNGQEAVTVVRELIEKAFYTNLVVLMDIQMPVLDGVQATVAIRELSQSPRPIVAALTAFASETERTRCLDAGMDYFLSKPLTKDNLHIFLKQFSLL